MHVNTPSVDYIISHQRHEDIKNYNKVHHGSQSPMDGGTQRGRPSSIWSFFSFVLSLEDSRSRKELAEDLIGDKDGLLMFVRRPFLPYSCTL
jgi:hypothetical protein